MLQGVAHTVCNVLFSVIIMTILNKDMMYFGFNAACLKEVWDFSSKLLLSNLLNKIYNSTRTFLIGKLYMPVDLAFFDKAYTYTNFMVQVATTSVSSVLLPVLSRKQNCFNDVKNTLRRSISMSVFFMFPILTLLYVFSESLVSILLTDKWMGSVVYFKIFCVLYIPSCFIQIDKQALLSVGKSGYWLMYEFVNCFLNILVLVLVVTKGVIYIAFSAMLHPSDDYARNVEAEPYGKTEMWYVLDSQKDSSLVYGFHNGVTKEQIEKSIHNNTICSLVHRVPVHPNDVFFIEPGTVHAICSGVLIAEIQQKSNLTYRLYDYDRIDSDGKKRELHIKKALDVIKINYNNEPLQPMRVLKYYPGSAIELLYRCEYFQVERILINTDRQRNLVEYSADNLSFRILLCIDGACTLFWGKKAQPVFKGDCLFIPAESCRIRIHGKAKFLDVSC